ncbi:hypothetical protein [Asticcacaulis solisilvae]|uniref:hypothetical protein n=1 Tax=Asticcacaulis solisilvae TaxID=1217274 RepID=UPI003FD6ED26
MRGFVSKLAGLVLGVGLLAFAGEAAACNTGCPPPAPPTPPSNPNPPNMPCHSCGGGGNTNVNVNVNVKASASGSANVFAGASSGAAVYGGGYGNWSQTPGYVQQAGGLAVVTGDEGYEAVSESRSVTRTLIIQASCIDDTGVPHPASQVFPDRDVANAYTGEVYRCIAGTHMQVVMADCLDGAGGLASDHAVSESASYSRSEEREEHSSYGRNGSHGYASSSSESHEEHGSSAAGGRHVDMACLSHVNFDGGKTMTCQKGDALWFDHGNMTCRAQIPARQCNERSLLRRFGVGTKMLTVTRTESFARKREVATSSKSSSVMVFDGGVGGFVQ